MMSQIPYKLNCLRIETKITIFKILQCANAVKSRCHEKGVEGQFGLKNTKVLHVFEDAFRGRRIFRDAFGKNLIKIIKKIILNELK